MGTDTAEDSPSTRALEVGRHDIVRCHAPDEPTFPCAALLARGCPLERDTVHAAVVVGSGTAHQTDLGAEEGSRCALRMHVPLVTVGYHDASPLLPWATEAVAHPENLGHAIERAVSAPMRAHEGAAISAYREVLETHDLPTLGAHVTVQRMNRSLRVELQSEYDMPPKVAQIAAVRVLSAVQAVDPHASTIGVSVGGRVIPETDTA